MFGCDFATIVIDENERLVWLSKLCLDKSGFPIKKICLNMVLPMVL